MMYIEDFIERVYIESEDTRIKCDKCVFTLVSPGYEKLLDDMFRSLKANGNVDDAQLIVFVVDANEECMNIINKYNAIPIHCHSLCNVHIDSKGIVYSAYKVIEANKYLFLDADTIILDSLQPIFDQLDSIPQNNLLICEDQYFYGRVETLADAFTGRLYRGKIEDFDNLLGRSSINEQMYPHIINTGVWACRSEALQQINETICTFKNVKEWSKDGFIREQFLVNLALAVNKSATILDVSYNWQLVINTFLKYILNNDKYDICVGYNLFALDYLEQPWKILNKIKHPDDIVGQRLFSRLSTHAREILIGYDSSETNIDRRIYDQIQFIQYLFNTLMVNLNLFDDALLHSLDNNIIDGIPPIDSQAVTVEISRINKDIIKRCYLEKNEQYCDIFYDKQIRLLHFNGLNKDHGYTRTFLNNIIISKERSRNKQTFQKITLPDIKFVISTHKKYQDLTLPKLIKSLVDINGISSDCILVVSGGWDEASEDVKDGITYHCVTHNSFDHTGLIDILENKIESKYWFNFQDTCEVGINFAAKLESFDKNNYEHISVDNQGFLNMGLFSWDFLQESKNYIMSLKNCNKERAILSEKTYIKLAKSTSFNTENAVVFGYGDVYGTNLLRNMIYFSGIDLYKYQSNIIENMKICDP